MVSLSFEEDLARWRDFDFDGFWRQAGAAAVERALAADRLHPLDYLALLSPAAEDYLEVMARRAHALTVQHFGRVVLLYTPLYLSNYCVNRCLYCGFNARNRVRRRRLTLAEVEAEAALLAESGLRQVLVLTGESRQRSPVSYLEDCLAVLRRYFPSLAVEVYPLEEEEYGRLAAAGADGLTIYQEVYDPLVYARLHPAGPKRDYAYRLAAPERAGRAGLRGLNIGALLGLHDWRREAFATGLHAAFLEKRFPAAEISVSFPRLRPEVGGFQAPAPVADRHLVQMLLALRLFLPRVGITLSTRESASFRDHLLPLGVTRLSAGSCTAVGGRLDGESEEQFAVSDRRSVAEVYRALRERGYQPVFQDWYNLEWR